MDNRPDHYDEGIEAIDVIESHGLNFNLGNVIKYVLRAGKKESQTKSDDLTKALWYSGRELTGIVPPGKSSYSPSATLIGVDGSILPGVPLPDAPQFTGTPGEKLIEYAGRVCYDSFGKENSRPTEEYIRHIVESRHTSVLGHAVLHFSGSEYALRKFAWMFKSEPGWYIDYANVLTINLRFVERMKSYVYEFYPEIWNAFHEAFPIVIRYKSERPIPPRIFPCGDDGKHRWASFLIKCSRSCSHELIRHSYQTAVSQRSTRYVDESDYTFVHHPLMSYFPSLLSKFSRDSVLVSLVTKQIYKGVIKKAEKEMTRAGFSSLIAKKAARGAASRYLPNGLQTELIFSASLYEWNEIFNQRISAHADSEIKELATQCSDILYTNGLLK